MASRRINLEIFVDDKGSLKIIGKDIDKVTKSTKQLGETANKTKRVLDGTYERSNRAGKDFSRMQQGMGGLVKAYATVAANVYALSSAFRVLQNNADMSSMILASENLASVSGRSFVSLAKDIQKAAGSVINMQESLTLANRASATGADNTQIQELSTLAAKAAQTFGGTTTDALNRFIDATLRGRTELVQKIGVVVSMEDAMEKYAASLKKASKDLSEFERQQAIINAIIEQGGKVLGDIKLDPNPYQQLSAAFQDIAITAIEKIRGVMDPLVGILKESVELMILLAAVIVKNIGKAAFPVLQELGQRFVVYAEKAKIASAVTLREFEKQAEKARQASLKEVGYIASKHNKILANTAQFFKKVEGLRTSSKLGQLLAFDFDITRPQQLKQLKGLQIEIQKTTAKIEEMKRAGQSITFESLRGALPRSVSNTIIKGALGDPKAFKAFSEQAEKTIEATNTQLIKEADKSTKNILGRYKALGAGLIDATATARSGALNAMAAVTKSYNRGATGLQKLQFGWRRVGVAMRQHANDETWLRLEAQYGKLGTLLKKSSTAFTGIAGGAALFGKAIAGLAGTLFNVFFWVSLLLPIIKSTWNYIKGEATPSQKAFNETLERSVTASEDSYKALENFYKLTERFGESTFGEQFSAQIGFVANVATELKSGASAAVQGLRSLNRELEAATDIYQDSIDKVDFSSIFKRAFGAFNAASVPLQNVFGSRAIVKQAEKNGELAGKALSESLIQALNFDSLLDNSIFQNNFKEQLEGLFSVEQIENIRKDYQKFVAGTLDQEDLAKRIKETVGVDFQINQASLEKLEEIVTFFANQKRNLETSFRALGQATTDFIKAQNAAFQSNTLAPQLLGVVTSISTAQRQLEQEFKAAADGGVLDMKKQVDSTVLLLERMPPALRESLTYGIGIKEVNEDNVRLVQRTLAATTEKLEKELETLKLRISGAKVAREIAKTELAIAVIRKKQAGSIEAAGDRAAVERLKAKAVIEARIAQIQLEILAGRATMDTLAEDQLKAAQDLERTNQKQIDLLKIQAGLIDPILAKYEEEAKLNKLISAEYLKTIEALDVGLELINKQYLSTSQLLNLRKSERSLDIASKKSSIEDLNIQLGQLEAKRKQQIASGEDIAISNTKIQLTKALLAAETGALNILQSRVDLNTDLLDQTTSILEANKERARIEANIASAAKENANIVSQASAAEATAISARIDVLLTEDKIIKNKISSTKINIAAASKELALAKESLKQYDLINDLTVEQVKNRDILSAQIAIMTEEQKSSLSVSEIQLANDERRLDLIKEQLATEIRRLEVESNRARAAQIGDEDLSGLGIFGDSTGEVAGIFARQFEESWREVLLNNEPTLTNLAMGMADTFTSTVEAGIDNLIEGGSFDDAAKAFKEALKAGLRETLSEILVNNIENSFGRLLGIETDEDREKRRDILIESNTQALKDLTSQIQGVSGGALQGVPLVGATNPLPGIVEAASTPKDNFVEKAMGNVGGLVQETNVLLEEQTDKTTKVFEGVGNNIIQTFLQTAGSAVATGIGSLFGFANGGIVQGGITPFADGGVVSKPTMALIGEGSTKEAIIPLPNNKSVPVQVSGESSGNVTISQSFDFRNADIDSVGKLRAEAKNIEQRTFNKVFEEINRGGKYAKTVGRRR